MPHFSIIDADRGLFVAEYDARDSGDILNAIHRLGCRNAHVLSDGDYFISARLDDNEVWSLYHRRDAGSPVALVAVSSEQGV